MIEEYPHIEDKIGSYERTISSLEEDLDQFEEYGEGPWNHIRQSIFLFTLHYYLAA